MNSLAAKRKEILRTLDTAHARMRAALLKYHYRYVDAPAWAPIVVSAVRDYVREHAYTQLENEVRWFMPCAEEESDFSKHAETLGALDVTTGIISARADVNECVAADVLLHESIHASQLCRYGPDEMLRRSTDTYARSRLEAEADRFASQHLPNLRWKLMCRMPELEQ